MKKQGGPKMTTTEALYRIWGRREEIGFGKEFNPEMLKKLCHEENIKEETYLRFAERKEAEECFQSRLELNFNDNPEN